METPSGPSPGAARIAELKRAEADIHRELERLQGEEQSRQEGKALAKREEPPPEEQAEIPSPEVVLDLVWKLPFPAAGRRPLSRSRAVDSYPAKVFKAGGGEEKMARLEVRILWEQSAALGVLEHSLSILEKQGGDVSLKPVKVRLEGDFLKVTQISDRQLHKAILQAEARYREAVAYAAWQEKAACILAVGAELDTHEKAAGMAHDAIQRKQQAFRQARKRFEQEMAAAFKERDAIIQQAKEKVREWKRAAALPQAERSGGEGIQLKWKGGRAEPTPPKLSVEDTGRSKAPQGRYERERERAPQEMGGKEEERKGGREREGEERAEEKGGRESEKVSRDLLSGSFDEPTETYEDARTQQESPFEAPEESPGMIAAVAGAAGAAAAAVYEVAVDTVAAPVTVVQELVSEAPKIVSAPVEVAKELLVEPLIGRKRTEERGGRFERGGFETTRFEKGGRDEKDYKEGGGEMENLQRVGGGMKEVERGGGVKELESQGGGEKELKEGRGYDLGGGVQTRVQEIERGMGGSFDQSSKQSYSPGGLSPEEWEVIGKESPPGGGEEEDASGLQSRCRQRRASGGGENRSQISHKFDWDRGEGEGGGVREV